jgi:hypothetical protein
MVENNTPYVEDPLAERGLGISYETVRRWVLKFAPMSPENFAVDVRGHRRGGYCLVHAFYLSTPLCARRSQGVKSSGLESSGWEQIPAITTYSTRV